MTDARDRLTPRQREVLDFIERRTAESGAPPTVREIGQALGIWSTNAVAGHLAALERHGVLTRLPHRSRGLRTAARPGTIPILGPIAAGRPIFADENLEGSLAADPFLVREPDETFALRVEGDSMTGDGILEGDYILVRKGPTADRGKIVVALLDDEATVKHYVPGEDCVQLVASNPAYAPIEVRPGDGRRFEILGTVVGVVRRM